MNQLHGAIGGDVEELEIHLEGKRVVLVPAAKRHATAEEFNKSKGKVFSKYDQLNRNLAKR